MEELKSLLVLPAMENIEEIVSGLTTPVELTKGKYSELEFCFKNTTLSIKIAGQDLIDFTNIWLSSSWRTRDLAYAVSLYLEHNHKQASFAEQACSKLTDQVVFLLNNISAPNTFFIDNTNVSDYIDSIEQICGYPLIIKDIVGAHGKNSVMVFDRIDLLQKTAKLSKNIKYLYQNFIPNDYDWGVLVVNGRVVSAEKSYPVAGEFRNNCGGATEIYADLNTVPRHVKDMALQAAAALGLSWSRSDIVVDKQTNIAYLMECNRFPGISSGTMEVNGAREFLEEQLNPTTEAQQILPNPIIFVSQSTVID